MTAEEARDAIAALEAVACRMAHERVRAVTENTVTRQPLCSAAVRNARLACGHSLARITAARAVTELQASGALPHEHAERLQAELTRIGDAIHALDHRKGDAEKARALGEEGAAERVRELEASHAAYVEQLREWKEEVLKTSAARGG